MADVTITNLDDRVLATLELCAKARGRSLQAELREALRNHVACFSGMQQLRRTARRIAAGTPPQQIDSVDLRERLREDRDP